MRDRSQLVLSITLAAGLAVVAPASAFTGAQQSCRTSVSKSGDKYAKTVLKAFSSCHKKRDTGDVSSGTDCNDVSAADPAGKLPVAAGKFGSTVGAKCPGITPSDVHYEQCPAPCDSTVPAIASFGDVVDCLVCLSNSGLEAYGSDAYGLPSQSMTADEASCHSSMIKGAGKYYNGILKAITKCQSLTEKDGTTEDITFCSDAGVNDLYDQCFSKMYDACQNVSFPNATLGACASDTFTAFDAVLCVCDAARDSAPDLATRFYDLKTPPATTTTTTTVTTTTVTTTTLPGSQDPKCPDVGELVLLSRDSTQTCASNSDCTAPRTCIGGLCKTVADLDSGWNGIAHDSDINDGTLTRANLLCEGPGPVCGQCTIAGLDPSPGNCRCVNNTRTICSDPFAASSPDCGACVGGSASSGKTCTSNTDCSFGTCTARCSLDFSKTCSINTDCSSLGKGTCSANTAHPTKCSNGNFCSANADCAGSCTGHSGCECFFGSPFPLNSGGTHACVVNRFADNITGTANVDEGSGDITAHLRTRVYLGINGGMPCPVCGGKCSNNPATACKFDSDCGSGNTCIQDTPDDGVRNGICIGGVNTGQTCDASGTNATFPAIGPPPVLPGGGQYSIDCQPSVGLNVSGTGLEINLEQTTGTTSLAAGVDCDAAGPGTALCPCLECSKDTSVACTSDAECAGQGSYCSTYIDPVTFNCTSNSDCTSLNLGTCQSNLTCSNGSAKTCATNADCTNQNGGSCIPSTCSASGLGDYPRPNACNGVCEALGDGMNGLCDAAGPDDHYCDGLLRIDGRGMKTCLTNADCSSPVPVGNCTLVERRRCFLDPIVAIGHADPTFPVAGSVFCIPPTGNPGINSSAGLPGPGRVISQGQAATFCASNHSVQYTPGVGGCP